MSTVLFSGRFDPFHLGHLVTIAGLAQRFDKVIVVILDFPEAQYPLCYRKQAAEEVIKSIKGNIEVVVNKDHFAEISKDALFNFKADVYASGNLEVLKHIESLGFKTLYVERSYEYSGTEIRMQNSVK